MTLCKKMKISAWSTGVEDEDQVQLYYYSNPMFEGNAPPQAALTVAGMSFLQTGGRGQACRGGLNQGISTSIFQ
jgi:hypothetical protein